MALVNCKECGEGVSSKAKECPHCGAPSAFGSNKIGRLIGVALIIIGILGLLYYWPMLKNILAY